MDCKEFEKLIPDFVERKLDFLTLEQFNKHRETCEDCQEELVIRYLVTEGIQRLEEGDAFDLQRELDQYYADADRKVRFHRRFLYIGEILEALGIMGVIGVVLWMLFY